MSTTPNRAARRDPAFFFPVIIALSSPRCSCWHRWSWLRISRIRENPSSPRRDDTRKSTQDGAPGPGNAQDGPVGPVSRESMWPAPTAEDWKKTLSHHLSAYLGGTLWPCPRRRASPSWSCVNMDGEPASEHYAGIRYRQPEIAKLYEPYVCVIASVYRHNPRDYDDQGRRIPCPRFGCVTCGEHIAIESILYEKFFEGQARGAAPTWGWSSTARRCTTSTTPSIRTRSSPPSRTASRTGPSPPAHGGPRRPAHHRACGEAGTFRGPDRRGVRLRGRRSRPSEESPKSGHGTLRGPRPWIFCVSPCSASTWSWGRWPARPWPGTDAKEAGDLISEALRVPMESSEREALVSALGRIGQVAPRSRVQSVVHRGPVSQVRRHRCGRLARGLREPHHSRTHAVIPPS